MCSAQSKTYKSKKSTLFVGGISLLTGVVFWLAAPSVVKAVGSTSCVASENCTIGEFLYDDSYVPDTAATCTLSTKYPDGTNHLSSQSLTSTADGWYGHTFTTPTTEGYYRGEICCDTTSSEHMCIDKSFEVKAPVSSSSDIASAVWGYSGRTLTGFNNIVADVWSYASRSLTSGENITTNNVSNADIEKIKKTTTETRLLVEELVNKPIIENSLEEVKDIDLGERVEKSKNISNELYINLLYTGTTITKTNRNWDKLTDREILDNLTQIKNILGEENDSSSTDSLFGKVNFIRDTWGIKEGDDLREEIKAIRETVGYVTTGVSSYGKSKSLKKEMLGASTYVEASQKVLASINKRIAETENLSKILDTNISEVNKILGSWTSDSYLSVKESVDTLYKKIISINKVPQGKLALDSVYTDITGEKKLKNKVLGLRGLLFANKKLLVSSSKTAFVANWLEEGSIVIKTLITNPSVLISQEVPLKYYLPKEVKKEHIINSDAGTEVKYDTEKDQLYVEGNFSLKPGETKTIRVRVEDVWQINLDEIASLKTQADNLIKPLEKTSFYAQGITLKSDIDVSLEKAKNLLKDGITPEAKIKSYREASLEILSSKEKIEKLKDMVSEASNSGSILGFVGGSQAIGVWGVVVAVVTGFVFMTIYMRKLLGKEKKKAAVVTAKTNTFDKFAVFLVLATISALSSSIAVKKIVLPQVAVVRANTKTEVLGSTTVNYKALKVVDLVSIDGVVSAFQDEGSNTVLELIDSGKSAIEVERGEKRVRVVYEGKEVWVAADNIVSK